MGAAPSQMDEGRGRALSHLVRPAVRLEGLGLARLRLGHVAMAVGACVLNFVSRAALDVVATAVLFFSREPEARGTRGQQIGLTRCAAALRRD